MNDRKKWLQRAIKSQAIMQKAIDNASKLISELKRTPGERHVAALRLRTSAEAFAKVLEEKYQE
jgi:hypothetical protein